MTEKEQWQNKNLLKQEQNDIPQDNLQNRSVSFKLARGTKTDLDFFCQNTGIPQNQVVCKAIDIYLERKKKGLMPKRLEDPYPVYSRKKADTTLDMKGLMPKGLKDPHPVRNRENPDTRMVLIMARIPQALDDALKSYCKENPYIQYEISNASQRKKRTKSYCIREAVSQYLYRTKQEIRDKTKKPRMPDLMENKDALNRKES